MTKLVCLLVIIVILKLLVKIGLIGTVLAATGDYRLSFDEYRTAYADYQLKQADFSRLKTHAAEEAYVDSARSMLILRSNTYSEYWQNSVGQIDTINSLTSEQKDFWHRFLDIETNRLDEHEQNLLAKKTLQDLSGLVTEINEQKEKYYQKAFEVNVEVIYGKLLDATLDLKDLNQELLYKISTQTIEEVEKDSIVRGLRINLDKLKNIETNLADIRQKQLDKASGSDVEDVESVAQTFMPEYGQLKQLMSLTQELSEGIAW